MSNAALVDTIERAARAAILGELIKTFETEEERTEIIILLRDGNIISSTTADMFHEIYTGAGE